jgi:hypothetical protein
MGILLMVIGVIIIVLGFTTKDFRAAQAESLIPTEEKLPLRMSRLVSCIIGLLCFVGGIGILMYGTH